jgi:carbamoyl-phosphate synthase large subunit
VAAELGAFPEVGEVAGAIATALGPLGPCNVQLRIHDGRPVPFEINPRFSGTTALRARMAFNEVEAALVHFVQGMPVPPLEPRTDGVVLRYWNELYVPAEAVDQVTRTGHLDEASAAQAETWGWGR